MIGHIYYDQTWQQQASSFSLMEISNPVVLAIADCKHSSILIASYQLLFLVDFYLLLSRSLKAVLDNFPMLRHMIRIKQD